MKETIESALCAGNSNAVLTVEKKIFGGKVELINSFSADDAIQLYSKLTNTPKENKEENNNYYICVLKDGKILDFDKKCNLIDYKQERFCAFVHDDGESSICLGAVPYENIKYIITKK